MAAKLKRYRVRLNDPNSGEFRITHCRAANEDAAVARALRIEEKAVNFRLPVEQLDQLEAKDADPDVELVGHERGLLHAHHQTEPYELAYVTEL